jgi:hypothetical protein
MNIYDEANYYVPCPNTKGDIKVKSLTSAKVFDFSQEWIDALLEQPPDPAKIEELLKANRLGQFDTATKQTLENNLRNQLKSTKATTMAAYHKALVEILKDESALDGLRDKAVRGIYETMGYSTEGLGVSVQSGATLKAQIAEWAVDPVKYDKNRLGDTIDTGLTLTTDGTTFKVEDCVNQTVVWPTLGNVEDNQDDLKAFDPRGFTGWSTPHPDRQIRLGINHLLLMLTKSKQNIRLVGPPGSGKSAVLRYCGLKLKIQTELIPCSAALTEDQVFGMFTIGKDKEIKWTDGQLTRVARMGKGLVIFDEIDHLAERRVTLQNGEILTLPKEVMIAATANTTGHGNLNRRHHAAKVADHALLSRLPVTILVDYMPTAIEINLLTTAGMAQEDAQKLVKIAEEGRRGIKIAESDPSKKSVDQALTLRETLAIAELVSLGSTLPIAFGTVLNGFTPGDRRTYGEAARAHFNWKT